MNDQELLEGEDFIAMNTSAKTGEGVKDLFQKIAKRIVDIKLG